MFQKKTLIVGFIVVALGLAFGTFFIRSNHKQDTKKVKASSDTATITTQGEWTQGELTNVSTVYSPGSIAIDNKFLGVPVLITPDQVTISSSAGAGTSNALDANPATSWSLQLSYNAQWNDCRSNNFDGVTFDLGSIRGITDMNVSYGNVTGVCGRYSANGTDWTSLSSCFYGSNNHYDTPLAARYIFVGPGNADYVGGQCPVATISEVYIQAEDLARAVHKTGATQIDGGANFWQWESFTDTKTVPANTSVTYRYRTSTDSTTWTGWVSSIGAVTSRTGDDSNNPTKYRYLQIEATLSNTDGTSTPTIDSYSIGYHTNQKPNAPSAMTAVIN